MSDSDEEKIVWVPFSERPEWKDVKPIPQDDGPDPVCPIAYTPRFSTTMDYFRAILHSGEKSDRALQLTAEVINISPANYTGWAYRRDILFSLKLDLREELKIIDEIGKFNPKNYQIWQHRQLIIQKLHDPSGELDFIAKVLAEDDKNYHAWAHRQWVIETFNLWELELDYVDKLLKVDFRNNSAWNQRYFVVSKWKKLTPDVIEGEIKYAFSFIKKAPNNQCPWVYLKGLLLKEPFSKYPVVKETCLDMKEMYISSPHVLSLLIDIAEQENNVKDLTSSLEYCTTLGEKIDFVRVRYWNYRKSKITERIQKLTAQ